MRMSAQEESVLETAAIDFVMGGQTGGGFERQRVKGSQRIQKRRHDRVAVAAGRLVPDRASLALLRWSAPDVEIRGGVVLPKYGLATAHPARVKGAASMCRREMRGIIAASTSSQSRGF